jgi:hypothetical protein
LCLSNFTKKWLAIASNSSLSYNFLVSIDYALVAQLEHVGCK